jgi:uncharacterized cupin superfamily protein
VTVVHWGDVEGFDIPKDVKPLGGHWQRLADAAGSVAVGVHRVRLADGEMMTPPHLHSVEEEIVHVLSGSATLWQRGTTCIVATGDTIVFPAGGPEHTLIGGDGDGGDGGVEVLVFGTRRIPESGVLPRTRVAWLARSTVTINETHPWKAEAALGIPEGVPGDRPGNVAALDDLEGDYGGIVKHPARACGAKQSGLNWLGLPPDAEGAPPHCHSADEEVFVVLGGSGNLELWGPPRPGESLPDGPNEVIPVRPGNVVARPPGTRVSHSFRSGPEGMIYLAYGTREPNDICYYPRSNKIFFRGLGVIGRLDLLEYSDGEPS